MGFEIHAYYVQDKTGTLYELIEHFPKSQQIAVQNVSTMTTTTHSESWAEMNLRLLRLAAPDDVDEELAELVTT